MTQNDTTVTADGAAPKAETPLEELERRRARALGMGGPDRIARHHASGRLTARERIALLIDPGSWFEIGLLAEPDLRREKYAAGDAIVTGLARVSGREVAIIAIDATVLAGTTAPVNMRKQNRVAEWAGRSGFPLICLSDNDGGRLPDLLGWRFSGVPFDFTTFLQSPPGCPSVPHMTAILGPSYGDAALHAAMGDFVVMQEDTALALSGPPVIQAAIGEDIDAAELGGREVATAISGSVQLAVPEEADAIDAIKRFMSYMPDTAAHPAPPCCPLSPHATPSSCSSSCRPHRAGATTCARSSRRSSTRAPCSRGVSATAPA